jgi:hypothetical protein
MPTSPLLEPGSAVPGVIPPPVCVHDEDPAPTERRDQPKQRKHPLAWLLSVIRGDKYMVDAYPANPKER